jgi:DNA (cytosine-5)-methyltransferase 1
MFVHPTQNRSLTPREAARIQSFPDWFRFPKARTKSFHLIGNAVPPLVSEAVGIATMKLLEETMKSKKQIEFWLKPLPQDDNEAVAWLLPLLDLDARPLRAVSADEFKKAWFAIAFLYMGLHPDSTLDHGTTIAHDHETTSEIREREPRLLSPYYERSGWPVVLAPVAKEAWRRYEAEQLSDDEFYCSEAQIAGICHRNPHLAEDVRQERERSVT